MVTVQDNLIVATDSYGQNYVFNFTRNDTWLEGSFYCFYDQLQYYFKLVFAKQKIIFYLKGLSFSGYGPDLVVYNISKLPISTLPVSFMSVSSVVSP